MVVEDKPKPAAYDGKYKPLIDLISSLEPGQVVGIRGLTYDEARRFRPNLTAMIKYLQTGYGISTKYDKAQSIYYIGQAPKKTKNRK